MYYMFVVGFVVVYDNIRLLIGEVILFLVMKFFEFLFFVVLNYVVRIISV